MSNKYLLIPSGTPLTVEEIVELYAKRMSIEQGFRDWKTHLGVRGLVFYGVNPAPRLTRLLLAFSLSYLLCLALGSTPEAQAVRGFVEILRHKLVTAPVEPSPYCRLVSSDSPCRGFETELVKTFSE